MAYIPPPADGVLPAFPEARRQRPKTAFAGGRRRRWKDGRCLYEWDCRHGTVEAYDLSGRHLGEFDAVTGARLGQADPERRVEP